MILGNYFIKLVFEKEEGALARSLCKGYRLLTHWCKGGPFAIILPLGRSELVLPLQPNL